MFTTESATSQQTHPASLPNVVVQESYTAGTFIIEMAAELRGRKGHRGKARRLTCAQLGRLPCTRKAGRGGKFWEDVDRGKKHCSVTDIVNVINVRCAFTEMVWSISLVAFRKCNIFMLVVEPRCTHHDLIRSWQQWKCCCLAFLVHGTTELTVIM